MRIVADKERCVGAGQCVLVDPEAFEQNEEDGTVVVVRPHPQSGPEMARAEEAVIVCPGRTLSLVKD